MINTVRADDIFDNSSETSESLYDDVYDEEELEEDVDDSNKMENAKNFNNRVEGKKGSVGLILTEVFCGIIGLFMLFLAFKVNES